MWRTTTEHGGSSPSQTSASSLFSSSVSKALRGGRSVLSIRRNNQVVSMETSQDTDLQEIDLFQTHIAQGLSSLLVLSSEEYPLPLPPLPSSIKPQHHSLLTMAFLNNLLDAYLGFDEEFRGFLPLVLSRNSAAGAVSVVAKPPLDWIISDYLDRSIKSLDICNAVTNSLDMLSYSQRDADIAAAAIRGKSSKLFSPNEAQFKRAKNATLKLLSAISFDGPSPKRTWSFGRTTGRDDTERYTAGPTGDSLKYPQRTLSLSLSLPENWSATKQLTAMAANLHPPREGEGGVLALAFYTMSSIQVLVMWVLVAAFPSPERCPAPGFPLPPQQLPWAATLMGIQERIMEDWKNERKGAATVMPSGMLAEVHGLEKRGKSLIELGDGAAVFPVDGDRAVEMETEAKEMEENCRVVGEEVGRLQKKVRDVFRRIMKSRAYVIDLTSQGTMS